ncbi:MAG: acetyl-CoA carboxylase biotin carboxyl carrier protein [Planctomycetales bacterium]
MSEKNNPSNPFDLEKLRELIRMMEEHDLNEVDLQKGDQRCRLRRKIQAAAPMMPAYPYPPAAPPVFPTAPPAAAAPSAAPAGAAAAADSGTPVKSPTLGTFYAAANPDDEPFVKVGSKVKRDTVVCLVEAMKVYNQITADVEGTVTEVCVSNGDAVEFGQVLFRVKPG